MTAILLQPVERAWRVAMAGSESVQVPLEAYVATSASSVSAAPAAPVAPTTTATSRHSALVRVTHWVTTLCFFALLITGFEIVISHPRFYWGETGNVLTPALFQLPIPSSRSLVQTGYGYELPDQNGWSRYLHFQAAWIVVLTGLLYTVFSFLTGHLRKDLLPAQGELSWRVLWRAIVKNLRFERPSASDAWSYNVLQRLTYLFVIFVLFPLVIWTGLAMSPAFVSAFPLTVTALGGQQSARTIHFLVSLALLLFVLVHVAMVSLAGFRSRMRAMITGRVVAGRVRTGGAVSPKERA
jgi:thiosulfate reductase cytochrome b subunit